MPPASAIKKTYHAGGLRTTLFAALFAVLAAVPASAPARADAAQLIRPAVAKFHAGRVLDAVSDLRSALGGATTAAEKYAILTAVADMCTYAYQHECLVQIAEDFVAAAQEMNNPRLTAPRLTFFLAFERFIAGDIDYIRTNIGMDFALRFADPITDPSLATRLYILDAKVHQFAGEHAAASEYISRALASLLRINTDTDRFDVAALLNELIAVLLTNHDTVRAVRWATITDGIIRANLPENGFNYARYLDIRTELHTYLPDPAAWMRALDDAERKAKPLQIASDMQEAILSIIGVEKAAVHLLRGDIAAASDEINANPIRARKDEIIARGNFLSYAEMLYAVMEIFVASLSPAGADTRWAPLLEHRPPWRSSVDQASVEASYLHFARGLLALRQDRNEGLRQLVAAAKERLDFFERGFADANDAFPLPSIVDRVILGMVLAPNIAGGDVDGDLVIGSMEVLNRDVRFAASDALAALASQPDEEERHLVHAVLRLSNQQADWEADKLSELASAMRTGKKFDSARWTAQLAMGEIAHARRRLSAAIGDRAGLADAAKLPVLADLQSGLAPSQAFLGYAITAFQAVRICVRRNGFWVVPMVYDPKHLRVDTKLLTSALTADYPPSEVNDVQYPVEAAMRLAKVLFDGLSPCLEGVDHLVFSAPGDIASIPVWALLRQAPVRNGAGYDLGNAHWLLRDFAVSYVGSVQNFLSSRKLAARAPGSRKFAGVGDPRLNSVLASGRTGAGELARRSAMINSASLQELIELPETRDELTGIARLMSGKGVDILLGDAATEERFRSLPLDEYQIIQFATHGLIRGDVPGLTEPALVLTPVDSEDPFNDGLLNASEIANLNLRARLVVLSACNTANIDLSAFGSQVQGLTTAFAVAGVPTTIVSLWSVESQTSKRIMVQFYRHLASESRLAVAEALRRSVLDAIDAAPSAAFRHPRFWAPFIVIGDGAADLDEAPSPSNVASTVEISETGGEILAAARADDGIVTSEIGPVHDGKHSSIVRMRSDEDGGLKWSREDFGLGAGIVVGSGDRFVVAGYTWDGKSTPVVRGINGAGKISWRTVVRSRFPSAVIPAIAALPDGGALAIVAPLTGGKESQQFDAVRFDREGRETARRALTIPDTGIVTVPTFSMTLFDDAAVIAVNLPERQDPLASGRNDFGYMVICTRRPGAYLYKLDLRDFGSRAVAFLPGIHIHRLQPSEDVLLYAGSLHTACDPVAETATFGRINNDLSATELWRDDAGFSTSLKAVVKTAAGYMGVGTVVEPLFEREAKPIDMTSFFLRKHFEFEKDRLAEVAILNFDRAGRVVDKKFVGTGLPSSVIGMIATRRGYLAYGNAGFNPWTISIQADR